LTLSENQHDHVGKAFAAMDSPRSKRVLLQGWEQFAEPVDRIVSIGAFEHFGGDRHDDFFAMAYRCMPADGVMLLHTITRLTLDELKAADVPLTMDAARFASFISKEIFPGGHLPTIEAVQQLATASGLTVNRTHSLQMHYARTLDSWAQALEANKSSAIEVQSEAVYDRYMKYLTGCADMFRMGYIDVNQFTLAK
jgi:cyclopropane-fatty-acyl-phospholipid synthase